QCFLFSSRRRHTRFSRDWSSDVCSSDLMPELYPWLINHSKSSWGVGYKLSNTHRRAHVLSRGMYVTMERYLRQMIHDHPSDVIRSEERRVGKESKVWRAADK